MAERLHPGVYVEEKSSGNRPIEGVGTSTAAFVGVASRGVPGLPTLVTSFDDYSGDFGGHLPGERGFLGLAVEHFFAAGGRRAYVVRVLPGNAQAAQQQAPQPTRFVPGAGSAAPALQFFARGSGRWADNIRLHISDATNFPDEAFRVEVVWSENGSARTLELFDDLRMDPNHPDHFAGIIDQGSRYITARDEFARANDTNTGTLTPVPEVIPQLQARTLAAGDRYTVNEGATLEFTWSDAAGGAPRSNSVTFAGGGLSFDNGVASPDAAQLSAFLNNALVNADNSRDFRVNLVPPATSGRIAISAPAAATQDLSGETLQFIISGITISIAMDGHPDIADSANTGQAELVTALGNALGPASQVQAVGNEIIITTAADAQGAAPQFSQAPDQNTLTINAIQAGNSAGPLTVEPNIASRGRIVITAPAAQAQDLSGQTLSFTIGGQQTAIVVANEVADASAVSQAQLAAMLTLRLGPDNPVDIVGDQVIVRTRAAADGAAPALATAPNNAAPAATATAGAGGTVIESLDGITLTASEAPNRHFPRTLRDIGFASKARGYEQNAAANPDVRPQNSIDPIRLVGGSDGSGDPGVGDFSSGLDALDRSEINLVALPGKNSAGYLSAALAYCDQRGDCFFVADGPGHIDDDLSVGPSDARAFIEGLPNRSNNAAMFYPWVEVPDPVGAGRNPKRFVPPSGHIAGICARTDINRGVWKAPAGIEAVVSGAIGVQYQLIDAEQDLLNPVGLNCVRSFPGTGIVSWGSRTLSSDPEWRYVPVRRTALFLKESLRRGLQWAVFEPNDRELWDRIRLNIDAFMLSLFRQGAFQGATPEEAFLVVCDRSTNPQDLVDQGIVTARVAFAPLKPAEFVVIEISQKTLVAG